MSPRIGEEPMSQTAQLRGGGMPGLKGKNLLVTGGSSGIGQAIAVRFAAHGANVAINYLTTPDEAAGTEEQVHACVSVGPGATITPINRAWVDDAAYITGQTIFV